MSRGRSRSPRSPRDGADMDIDRHSPGPNSGARVIIVTNLTRNVVEAHLKSIFSHYGQITKIDLPVYPKSGQNKGKAALEYAAPESASKARTHMDGGQLDGAVLKPDLPLAVPEMDETVSVPTHAPVRAPVLVPVHHAPVLAPGLLSPPRADEEVQITTTVTVMLTGMAVEGVEATAGGVVVDREHLIIVGIVLDHVPVRVLRPLDAISTEVPSQEGVLPVTIEEDTGAGPGVTLSVRAAPGRVLRPAAGPVPCPTPVRVIPGAGVAPGRGRPAEGGGVKAGLVAAVMISEIVGRGLLALELRPVYPPCINPYFLLGTEC